MVVFARRLGVNAWSVMDLCAAATPMGLFFGRLANFINGELWGGRPRSLGDGVSRGRAGAAPSSQLTRLPLEGLVLFGVLSSWLTKYQAILQAART